MRKNLVCGECGGEMQEGYILDSIFGGAMPTIWIEGIPEKTVWAGLKISGKAKYLIIAYRCKNCGFLKLYTSLSGSAK